jgi:hypothetical protein
MTDTTIIDEIEELEIDNDLTQGLNIEPYMK